MTFEKIERLGSIQWPCNDAAPEGTPTMHVQQFVRGKGKFWPTEYVPTSERSTRTRSEEHTSELQSPCNLVCRLLLEKKKHQSLTDQPSSHTLVVYVYQR